MKRLLSAAFWFSLASYANTAWAAEGGNESGGFPTKAIIFAVVNFLILLFILGYFLRKPLKDFFASRAVLIKKDIEDSQAVRDEAAQKYQEYEQRLKEIEEEMRSLIEELKKDGELERVSIVKETHDRVKNLKETSERVMSQEVQRAKEELKQEAVAWAAQLAEELVRKNLTPDDQQKIVKRYMDRMEQQS